MDPLFLVEHFDPADRRAWFSCDRNWTRRNILEGIADGQMECVVKVLEIHESDDVGVACWTFDETRDIAEDVETFVLENRGGQFSYNVLSFLQANGLRQYASAAE